MKQTITVEQFNELGNKQRQLLRDWWRPRAGDHAYFEGMYKVLIEADSPFVGTSGVKYYPILSIGQMIEFLDESGEYSLLKVHSEVLGLPHNWGVGIIKDYNLGEGWVENEYIIKYQENVELCDALWEAVKEELEKE